MAGHASHWSHEATFDTTPTCASDARTFVSGHLVEHRLLYLVDPVRLVASELATNAMVHANTAFSVTLAAMDETVVLTVRDRSLRFPTRRPTQVMATRGRGLDIVDFVALEWGINDDEAGSKAVWASFAIRAATEN